MKILVTGGAGFIGSHVADAYLKLGHKVVVLDNLSSGNIRNVPKQAKFIKMDLRDRQGILRLLQRERFKVVNHHAAQISVPDSVRDPLFDAAVNVLGLLHLLEAGRATGLRKFIYISSGGTVYGEPRRLPASERYPIQPLSPYGISKAVGENYLRFYQAACGIDYTVLRYANVYGPRQMPHGEAGVVSIFILKMLGNKAPTIFGNGKILRDYVYVGDVVRANVLALRKGSRRAYNISTGRPTSVLALYRSIARELGFRQPPKLGPPRPGDVRANYLSWARARGELGWSPRVDLVEGIRLTAEFFRARPQER